MFANIILSTRLTCCAPSWRYSRLLFILKEGTGSRLYVFPLGHSLDEAPEGEKKPKKVISHSRHTIRDQARQRGRTWTLITPQHRRESREPTPPPRMCCTRAALHATTTASTTVTWRRLRASQPTVGTQKQTPIDTLKWNNGLTIWNFYKI